MMEEKRWTVTTHREDAKLVVVLREWGHYRSTAYSKSISLHPSIFNQTPWLRVQNTISRYQRKADRLNEREARNEHNYELMVK